MTSREHGDVRHDECKLFIYELLFSLAMKYLSEEQVIALNALAIALIPAKKSDATHLASRTKLTRALEECRSCSGDAYAKAVVLLREIVRAHAFVSANRRTALLATKEFLIMNGGHLGVPDDPRSATVLRGIRESYYSDEEIEGWLRYGTIKEFRR